MKKYFRLIYIVLFFSLSIVHSLNAQCAGRVFPYGFGGGAPLSVVCTNNPGQTSSSIGKPVNKWPSFSDIQWSINIDNIVNNSGGCVDGAALKSCIESAWSEWTSICSSSDITTTEETPGTANVISIDINTNHNSFPNPAGDAAITPQAFNSDGSPSQSDFFIKLNYSQDFQSNFNFAYPCPPDPFNMDCTVDASLSVNPCAVIRHEIGHVFGLLDESKFCPSTANSSDLMYGSIGADCEDRGITDDDKCYFCKLYCPGSDGCPALAVKQDWTIASKMDITIFPNPATKNVNITYSSPEKVIAIVLCDISGKVMQENDLRYPKLTGSSSMDIHSLSGGSYIIQVRTEHAYASRLLIVN
jgi:hypothetical protein